MKLNSLTALLFVFIFIILGVLVGEYFFTKDNNHKINELLLGIEKQSIKIDSINYRNRLLSQELKQYKHTLDSIDITILKTKAELQTLNEQTNEKLSSIKYFSVNELERFFTERYSNRLNSKD